MKHYKVLVLEDDVNRINLFQAKFERDPSILNPVFLSSVNIAKAYIMVGSTNILFLDHDLDDRTYVDSTEENTGYQLCKWLVEEYEGPPFDQIFIHSMNTVGATNMEKKLQEKPELVGKIYRIPFPSLMSQL